MSKRFGRNQKRKLWEKLTASNKIIGALKQELDELRIKKIYATMDINLIKNCSPSNTKIQAVEYLAEFPMYAIRMHLDLEMLSKIKMVEYAIDRELNSGAEHMLASLKVDMPEKIADIKRELLKRIRR